MGEHVTYPSGDGIMPIRSYLAVPLGPGRHPAVLLLRGVAGPDDGYIEIADRLAGAGYAALVHRWQVRGDDPADDELRRDIDGALAFLHGHAAVDGSRLAVFGFCRGGGQALLAAAAIPALRVVVPFHGFARRRSLDADHPCHPIDIADRVHQPVLLLHGDADEVSPIDEMQALADRLQAGGTVVEFVRYASARHGFAVRTHPGYLATAADDALWRAIAFVDKHL